MIYQKDRGRIPEKLHQWIDAKEGDAECLVTLEKNYSPWAARTLSNHWFDFLLPTTNVTEAGDSRKTARIDQ